MKDLPKEVYWYGSNRDLIKPYKFFSGPLELHYESGLLRNIRIGEYEVIRMIYFALRDRNWETIIPVIKNEQITESDRGYKIAFESHFDERNIRFVFHSEITCTANSQVVFEINGEALSGFLTNRTGFCVLHPIDECRGRPCEITNPAGNKDIFTFPELISPHQPMKDITEMSWELKGIGRAHIKFEGDIFETEDQRNWTDDSYKTYCRPLELPFPYKLKKGERIHQKITLTMSSEHKIHHPASRPYHLNYNKNIDYPLPDVGIAQSPTKPELSDDELTLIKKADFDYYEINVVFDSNWKKKLELAVSESKKLDLHMGLKLHFSGKHEQEIAELKKVIANHNKQVSSVTILHQDMPVVTDDFIVQVLITLREIFPYAKIGAGTTGFFADLNRNRILNRDLDFLSLSMTPQVHAFDNLTLIENLKGQASVVESALDFSRGKDIHVSPVTLRMQVNPAATSETTDQVHGLSSQVDPRQMSLFGAGWTLGSIKKLTEAGASAVTYYETVGEKGIVQGTQDPAYPGDFQVRKNAIFPMFYLFKEILNKKGSRIVKSFSSHPTTFDGLVLKSGETTSFLMANYTDQQIEIRIDDIHERYKVVELHEDNVEEAMYLHDRFNSSAPENLNFEGSSAILTIRPFGISIIREFEK